MAEHHVSISKATADEVDSLVGSLDAIACKAVLEDWHVVRILVADFDLPEALHLVGRIPGAPGGRWRVTSPILLISPLRDFARTQNSLYGLGIQGRLLPPGLLASIAKQYAGVVSAKQHDPKDQSDLDFAAQVARLLRFYDGLGD